MRYAVLGLTWLGCAALASAAHAQTRSIAASISAVIFAAARMRCCDSIIPILSSSRISLWCRAWRTLPLGSLSSADAAR